MKKHSAGPFTLENVSDYVVRAADGYDVAAIPDDPHYGRPEEDAANAELFADGPAMLEALQKVYWESSHQMTKESFERIGALLEKHGYSLAVENES